MEKQDIAKTVQEWLGSLGTSLALDADGCCSMTAEDGTIATIEVSPQAELVHLYSLLLPFATEGEPSEEDLDNATKALEINSLPEIVQGGAIALAPDGKQLIFCQNISIEGNDASTFSQQLVDFMTTVASIKEALLGEIDADAMDDELPEMTGSQKYFKV